VKFQAGRGAPARATFPQLADFRDNADAGIRYFSGIATYARDIIVPAAELKAGHRLWLDLGQVNDLAEIWVNGALAGTAWKPPYRVDITKMARPGANRVEIRVVNLWVNRLIGDVQPGITHKITFTGADGKKSSDPENREGAIVGRMPYGPDAPLRPSGLVGPVQLLVEER
jgi:hypothetical protein